MTSYLLLRKAITFGMTLVLVAVYSFVVLANSGKAVGELVVTGSSGTSFVTVNGEPAKNGRTVFSSSTLTTPAEFGAVVNLGKAGKIELSPNSTFVLTFDDASISGDLTSGSVTVLNAQRDVQVKTLSDTVTLNSGETAAANSAMPAKQAKSGGVAGIKPWVWVAIFGGAIAAVVLATRGDNGTLTGATVVVSPTR